MGLVNAKTRQIAQDNDVKLVMKSADQRLTYPSNGPCVFIVTGTKQRVVDEFGDLIGVVDCLDAYAIRDGVTLGTYSVRITRAMSGGMRTFASFSANRAVRRAIRLAS